MRIFEEKQKFSQWWLIAIMAIPLIGVSVNAYYETEGFSDIATNISSILTVLLVILILGCIFILELRTNIDAIGIRAYFYPFPFFRKKYLWSQIEKVYVRKYSPLTEYGGWGVRGLGEAKAYNVSGKYGIQIVTKEKKKFLIGTQKPQDVERVLKRYIEKK